MKKTALFLALVALLTACHDKVYNKYMSCVPVYTDYETFRQPAAFEAPKTISKNGNIYIKDNYLFVIEPDGGIHFINNADRASPVNVGFLDLTGCTGMSIKDNYLYANSFIDLVIFDIADITNPVEVRRIEDIFPQALPVVEKNYPMAPIDKNRGVVTSWEYKETKEETTTGPTWNNCFNCETLTTATFESQNSGGAANTGISGSITKFTIIGDYLYVMDYNQLKPVNIVDPLAPVTAEPIGVWADVETLFPHNNYIFMGTTTGMLVYNTTNPAAPEYMSSVSHMRGCDPVVVQDNYCYVTVRSNGDCGGDINQLDVIDISDIANPVLKKSFQMDQPHGLGISGTTLFICDGESGLKIFDATNPLTCGDNLVQRFSDIQATDVIPLNGVAIVIGEDGIRQYDYSDPKNLKLLSSFNF